MTAPDDNRPSLGWSYRSAFAQRPMATAAATGSISLGICALILGGNASRAFSLIPGGATIAHLLGALMVIGGILATAGTIRLGTLVELLGLVLVAAGMFLYSTGVLLGLGTQGLIAAHLAAIFFVGSIGRVFLLAKYAHVINQSGRDD